MIHLFDTHPHTKSVFLASGCAISLVTLCSWPSLAFAAPIYNSTTGHFYDRIDVSGGLTWDQAKLAAESRSVAGVQGHLMTINSAAEQKFLEDYLPIPKSQTSYVNPYWLGGYQPSGSSEPAGNWKWITGETWSYSNWDPGEPNNNGGIEDVLHIGVDTNPPTPKWNDVSRNTTLGNGGYYVEYPTQLRTDKDLIQKQRDPDLSPLPSTKNLIVFTHGLNTTAESFNNGYWKKLGDELKERLEGKADWEVVAWDWTDSNQHLSTVLQNAASSGDALGSLIANGGYEHVHLIGHSAGANLINEAARVVSGFNKLKLSNTTVHTTFLDPFAPELKYIGKVNDNGTKEGYGAYSDWSDNYSVKDALTGGNVAAFTYNRLKYAHNVDVQNASVPGARYNSKSPENGHGWPIQFYAESVASSNPLWNGYGYGRSKEGGGWGNNSGYSQNNSWVYVHDFGVSYLTAAGTVIEDGIIYRTDDPQEIGSLPYAKSDEVQVAGTSIDMLTSSPAWISVLLYLSQPVSYVEFDTEFLSGAGAEGLLAMYWDGDVVGTVDERYVIPGSSNYTTWLPDTMQPGIYELSFRLDPYTAVQSRVVIDNIQTGFVGIPEPTTLCLLALSTALLLTGGRRRD